MEPEVTPHSIDDTRTEGVIGLLKRYHNDSQTWATYFGLLTWEKKRGKHFCSSHFFGSLASPSLAFDHSPTYSLSMLVKKKEMQERDNET